MDLDDIEVKLPYMEQYNPPRETYFRIDLSDANTQRVKLLVDKGIGQIVLVTGRNIEKSMQWHLINLAMQATHLQRPICYAVPSSELEDTSHGVIDSDLLAILDKWRKG